MHADKSIITQSQSRELSRSSKLQHTLWSGSSWRACWKANSYTWTDENISFNKSQGQRWGLIRRLLCSGDAGRLKGPQCGSPRWLQLRNLRNTTRKTRDRCTDNRLRQNNTEQTGACRGWYLIELRKILVRKFLATWISVSDGIVRGDTTSTILALMGSRGKKRKEERQNSIKGFFFLEQQRKAEIVRTCRQENPGWRSTGSAAQRGRKASVSYVYLASALDDFPCHGAESLPAPLWTLTPPDSAFLQQRNAGRYFPSLQLRHLDWPSPRSLRVSAAKEDRSSDQTS